MIKKYNILYQLKIVSVVAVSLIFITVMYLVLSYEMNSSKETIIKNWSQWQKITINNLLDEATSAVTDNFENHIVTQVVPKLKFNGSGYAVFYRNNEVVYENNAELTSKYSGMTIRNTYGAYSYNGGYDFTTVLEAMEEGISGSGYFVKNHAKGREQITWTSFIHNGNSYILGGVIDENYILNTFDFEHKNNSLYALSFVCSFLIILLSSIICFDTYKHNAAVSNYEMEARRESKLISRLKNTISELDERFEKLSISDFLTGLYNRKFFDIFYPKLESDIFMPVSIALIDINGLKLINNTFGYQAGDDVLIGISNIMTEICDERDVITRHGTDEFAIIMINTPYQEAVNKLLNISKEVSERYLEYSVEISFGISTKKEGSDNIHHVVEKAEVTLGIDKLTAKNSYHSGSVNMLRRILQEKTTETEEHCERIKHYAEKLATAIGMDEQKVKELGLLAYLHDVGKISIPDAILNKETPLTIEEYDVIKNHTIIGYNIAMASPTLKVIAKYILQHHERWDGKGYPKGLKGEEISIEARIISIADAFDAMVSKRVYKEGYSLEASMDEIEKNAGTQFDPELAMIFVKIIREGHAYANSN